MRTIKFRGIDTMSGEMVYGDLVQQELTDGSITTAIVQTYATYDVKPETVGQFTGLYDKNGNEIYEGDILLWHTMYFVVEWRQEDCRYVLVGCHDNEYVLNAYKCNIEDDFEVIGNIHDKQEEEK